MRFQFSQLIVIQLIFALSIFAFTNILVADDSVGSNKPLIIAAVESEESENLPAAVVWYLELAEQGDMDAQYNLGSIYETGFGVGIDLKKAVKWYKKAARQGHPIAQLKLGLLYYLGKGVRESTIKGSRWIRESAELGNSLAILLNEKVLAHDTGIEVDQKKLIAKTLRAFEKGQINAEETLRLEIQKLERQKKDASEKPRFAGNVTGSGAKPGTVKNELPSFLDQERAPVEIVDDSLDAIKHRAKEGVSSAQYKLGYMYEKGLQVEQDKAEAFKWYTASASQNFSDAQYRLGLAYLYGEGTEQSTVTAGTWLVKARNKKHPAATLLLSHISSSKAGFIDKPHSILLTWYLEKSLAGDGEAMLAIGNMYQYGWGVAPDQNAAKKWLAKARAVGVKGAAKQLRRMKSEQNPSGDSGADRQQSNTLVNEPSSNVDRAAVNDSDKVVVTTDAASVNASKESNHSIWSQFFSNEMLDEFKTVDLEKYKRFLTPISLVVLGLFMGMIVFRWMRNSNRNSVL